VKTGGLEEPIVDVRRYPPLLAFFRHPLRTHVDRQHPRRWVLGASRVLDERLALQEPPHAEEASGDAANDEPGPVADMPRLDVRDLFDAERLR
jgi:hypothetical protein